MKVHNFPVNTAWNYIEKKKEGECEGSIKHPSQFSNQVSLINIPQKRAAAHLSAPHLNICTHSSVFPLCSQSFACFGVFLLQTLLCFYITDLQTLEELRGITKCRLLGLTDLAGVLNKWVYFNSFR